MKILELIIDNYIENGKPVSSRFIADIFESNISSATIRNEMAVLYELGFLDQPYISSGKIPSQAGYRLYIDEIMKKQPLKSNQTNQIAYYFSANDLDHSSLIKNSGKLLSQITGCMTIISSMAFDSLTISKIEVIKITNTSIVILLITSSGIVKSKVCKLDFDLNSETMDFIYRYINDLFANKSVKKISKDYINSITNKLNIYHNFFSPIFYSVYEMCENLESSDFYIDGQTNLLFYDDLKDCASNIIKILSSKNIVNDILTNCFDNLNEIKSGVAKVKIGLELNQIGLADICIIASKYNIAKVATGFILAAGPKRINYSIIIPWVEYFSNILSIVLSESLDID